jgi:hypothetical protein
MVLAMVMMASLVFGASIPLKATWTPNTETDMASYKLYRTDGTRTIIGTISHPPTFPYLFTITVPDGSQGTITFVVTAIDTSANESGDSNVASFPFDLKAPLVPKGLSITK